MSLGALYVCTPGEIRRTYLLIDEAVAMVTVLILCHEYGQNMNRSKRKKSEIRRV